MLAASLSLKSDILPGPLFSLTKVPEYWDFRKHLTTDLKKTVISVGLGRNSDNVSHLMDERMLKGPGQSQGR